MNRSRLCLTVLLFYGVGPAAGGDSVVQQRIEEVLRAHVQYEYDLFTQDRIAELEALEGPFGPSLPDEGEVPEEVKDTILYYREAMGDSGGAWAYQVDDFYVVYVTTDGDDSWIEAFDAGGQLQGAARGYLELLAWGDRESVRHCLKDGGFPPELDDRSERTLWGKPRSPDAVSSPPASEKPPPLVPTGRTVSLKHDPIQDGLRHPDQVTSLDLYDVDMLPSEIGKFTRLRKLKILRGRLASLPEEIAGCVELEEIVVTSCRLADLPQALASLPKLRRLWLSGNAFTALPPVVAQLVELRTLCVSGNKLSTLPEGVGRLSHLEELIASDNSLVSLPETVGGWVSLLRIDLDRNRLTSLPAAVSGWKLVTRVSLCENQLVTLPPEIGGLESVQWLALSRNLLGQLPGELARLGRCTELFLEKNRLAELPDLSGMGALQRLYLDDNLLTEVPAWIGRVQTLDSLYVGGNLLTALPDELALPKLRSLSILRNRFTELPLRVIARNPALEAVFCHGMNFGEQEPERARLACPRIKFYFNEYN